MLGSGQITRLSAEPGCHSLWSGPLLYVEAESDGRRSHATITVLSCSLDVSGDDFQWTVLRLWVQSLGSWKVTLAALKDCRFGG